MMITHESPYSVSETVNRLEKILNDKGIKIFARINHAQAARDIGLILNDTEVLLFGDPKIGTRLMQEDPLISIELPLKILAWQDQSVTKITYEKMSLMAGSYSISKNKEVLEKMTDFLNKIVIAAIS